LFVSYDDINFDKLVFAILHKLITDAVIYMFTIIVASSTLFKTFILSTRLLQRQSFACVDEGSYWRSIRKKKRQTISETMNCWKKNNGYHANTCIGEIDTSTTVIDDYGQTSNSIALNLSSSVCFDMATDLNFGYRLSFNKTKRN
jgi:hypothetical protein